MKTIETKSIKIGKKCDPFNRSLVGIYLAFLFSILAFLSQGQKVTCDSLIGNFTNKRITGLSNRSVNHKRNYAIRIDSLNTALYKVQFKFNDFDWETEPPASLSQLLPGVKSYVSLVDQRALMTHDFSSLVDGINNILDSINKTIDSVKKLKPGGNNIKEYAKTMINHMKNDSTISPLKFLANFQNDIAYIKGLYTALKEFNAESPNGKFEYVQLLASLEGIINQLNTKNYPKLLAYIISFAKEEPKNHAESDIHFPEKEVTTLQIIVTDRFTGDTICNYSTDIYRTGVFKIDFSTGIGVNSLVKPTYSMANNGSPYIHKENGRDADLSVMALLHANWRLSRNFTFGPTAGVSVSTFDANTGFVLGISGSFGTRNTISVSTGGIMGKSYKLSSRVSSDGNKADIPLESGMTEIPKVDAVNYGWFVSVTYNLTRIKKKP